MESLALQLLGSPQVELDGAPVAIKRQKLLALLVYLALSPHPQRRDHLATLFWPENDRSSGRANLRRTLSRLNRTLDKRWLLVDGEQVSLKREDNFWLDVAQFEQFVAAAANHNHPSREVCADCLPPLGQAVALYQNDFLTGFTLPDCPEFDDWQLFQTESLRRDLAETLEKLARGHAAQGEFGRAIEFARCRLALDPLHEAAQRQVMRLLALAGQRSAALTQYENCRQTLADELGLEPTAETTALYQQIRQGELIAEARVPTPQPPSPPAPRHNLPPQLTPFIGRVEEVAEVARLLGDEPACRLLTLVGAGGIGKTRLALQAAADLIDAFPNGLFFISLAPISAIESLIPTMADALNLPLSGGQPKAQLLNYLDQKELLLLLDNFEQLIPVGGTDLLSEIVGAAPGVKLLVTSRERLNLQAEWGVEVRGLRFPDASPTQEESPEEIKTYDAVQLFRQRAQRVRPGFTLSNKNSPDIGRICQMVAGMPLGLELAATWLRMMSCREIVQEIERSLDFLTASLRDVPERHQSLRAVFEHSWRLLSEEEQAVFRQLSVFRGGFRRRAAERVAGASLPLLSALVDKWLLRRTRSGRYEIHELLRQFAAEKLGEMAGESDRTHDQHSEYYLTYLQQQTGGIKGRRQKDALDDIAADIDNIRVAWYRAIARRNIMALGKAADGLLLFSEYRGWYQEGAAAAHQAMQRLTLELEKARSGENKTQLDLVLARLLRAEGWFSVRLKNIQHGQALLQASIDLLRQVESESERDLAHSLHWLSYTYWFQGNYLKTKQHSQESLAIFTKSVDRWGMGMALYVQGIVAGYQGEYLEADRNLMEGISHLEAIGELRWKALSIGFLGVVARLRGEYSRARRYLQEGLRIKRDFGDLIGVAYNLRELGYLAIALGNYRQAKAWMQESATIFRMLETRHALVFPLDGLGTIARLEGKYQQAEQLHQDSLTMCQELEEPRGIALCLNNMGLLAHDMQDYPTAEQHLQESLPRYKEIGHQHGVASAYCNLGYVAYALGGNRKEEAKEHFQQSLTLATEIGARPVALNALVGWATWLSAGEPGEVALEQAVELLALALHHPASEQETRDRASQLLAELQTRLPPELVTAAQKRGKNRDLEATVTELLDETKAERNY